MDFVLLICNFSMFKIKIKQKNWNIFCKLPSISKNFQCFLVFLRIAQIKVSYYIEKSKTCEFSSGCSFFDTIKVGRVWKMFEKYDAIFTIGSLARKFYRHQYQSLKLGFLYLYYTYFIYAEKFYTLFLFIYFLQAWYINRNKKIYHDRYFIKYFIFQIIIII